MRYGITNDDNLIQVWSGEWFSDPEAYGYAYKGDDRIHLTLECGQVITIKLPNGITFPRTDDNFDEIDMAISDAMNAAR